MDVSDALKFSPNVTTQQDTTYPLEDLLPPHILQPGIQILNLLDQCLDQVLVRALDLACLANRHINGELDRAVHARA
jgi:hypothetical protein